jgi:hypothetical protein
LLSEFSERRANERPGEAGEAREYLEARRADSRERPKAGYDLTVGAADPANPPEPRCPGMPRPSPRWTPSEASTLYETQMAEGAGCWLSDDEATRASGERRFTWVSGWVRNEGRMRPE